MVGAHAALFTTPHAPAALLFSQHSAATTRSSLCVSSSPLLPRSYFETEDWKGIPGQWWFGGGTDITPNYIVEEDMRHFHGVYKVRSAVQAPARNPASFVPQPLLGGWPCAPAPCPRLPGLAYHPSVPSSLPPLPSGRVRPPRPHLVREDEARLRRLLHHHAPRRDPRPGR